MDKLTTPEAIKTLITEVINQGLTLAWWQSVIIIVVSTVVAAFVALLASYFTKRGELRALNENSETARAQLEKITEATKNIEEEIKLKFGKELEHYRWELQVNLEFKKSVMPQRLEALKKLWSLMEPLSLTLSTPLDSHRRAALYAALRSWYYDEGGGMFLGLKAADLFLNVRETLQNASIDDKTVREAFSPLRTQLKVDIGVYSPDEARTQIGPGAT